MNRFLVLVVTLLFSGAAFASTYQIKCLNAKGKFSPCKVSVDSGQITIEYKNKKEKDLNIVIPSENVKLLTSGEYSRRRVAEAILFTPWILFSKKQRDHVGIEYVNANNNPKATILEIHKKYGMGLKMELRATSGKVIQEE